MVESKPVKPIIFIMSASLNSTSADDDDDGSSSPVRSSTWIGPFDNDDDVAPRARPRSLASDAAAAATDDDDAAADDRVPSAERDRERRPWAPVHLFEIIYQSLRYRAAKVRTSCKTAQTHNNTFVH